jgi:hypothetical protein
VSTPDARLPILSSKTLLRFCEAEGFGALKRVPVFPAIEAEIDHCYPNVERQVERFGGELVNCFKILEFPDILIQAIHHAVWLNPKGQFVDITPDIRGWRHIVLAVDSNNQSGRRPDKLILPRFFNTCGLPEVDQLISVSERLTALRLEQILPDGALPGLDQTNQEVLNLSSEGRMLLALAQSKVKSK